MTTRYEYREESGHIEDLTATTLDEALNEARELLHDGDWEPGFVHAIVAVMGVDDDGDEYQADIHRVTVQIEPEEPECAEDDHDWRSPYSVLGGIKENPGVWGKGGGVMITEVCRHCGAYRNTDTWAQDMSTGEQGLTSVEYRDADEDSLAYVLRSRLRDAESDRDTEALAEQDDA